MKSRIIFFIMFACCFACKHENKSNNDSIIYIKNDSGMNERYDYESTDGGKQDAYIEQNGWVIYKTSIDAGGAFYKMYPPPPEFYEITKLFYPNGNIKTQATFLGGEEIDTTRYYSEDGYLVKEVNENKKFGTVKPAQILKFLEREGWINLKTGEGRSYPVVKDNKFIKGDYCIFELKFEPVGESYYVKNNKVPIWVATIPYYFNEDRCRGEETRYIIDGETGQVLKKTIEEKRLID